MKNTTKLLIITALISLSTIVTAYDGETTDLSPNSLGIGCTPVTANYCFDDVNKKYNFGAAGDIYLYGRYGGLINLTLNLQCPVDQNLSTRISYLNWSKDTKIENWYSPNGDINYSLCNGTTKSFNISFWSNTGILRMTNGANAAYIYYESSQIKYTTNQYLGGTYAAGVLTRIPVVNRFYPQKTSIETDLDFRLDETTNNTGFYISDFTPACTIGDEEDYSTFFYNRNTSQLSQNQLYQVNLNISSRPDLNITTFTYPAESTQLISALPSGYGQVNLSVTASQPGLVDAICWYSADNNYSSTGAIQCSTTNYSLDYQFMARPEPYYVEVQLEDNDCGDYPTRGFWLYVGKYVNLSGTVYGREGTNPPYALSGALINLNSTALGYSEPMWTDSAGKYSFTGLYAGVYTAEVSHSDYTTNTTALNLPVGTGSSIGYQRDFVLTYTGEEQQNITLSMTCTANTSGIDIKCCVDTNLDLFLVTAFDLTNTESSSVTRTGTGCFYYSDYTDLNCGANYEVFVEGFKDTTTNNVYTLSCAATTTTTTSTTTTTLPTPSLDCTNNLPATGNDTYCCVSAVQDTIWISYSVPNESVSGGHIFNNTDLGGTGFCFTVLQNLTSPYSFCDTLYDIWVVGYYTETSEIQYTNECNGSPQTTTTTSTTTTLPMVQTGCNIYKYDLNRDCKLSMTEFDSVQSDRDQGLINSSCYSSIEIYYIAQWNLPGCSATITTQGPYQPPTNWTTPNISCNNLTGKIMTGDIFHASTCAFIIPLGVSWFYGLSLLFSIAMIYVVTKSTLSSGIIGLLWTSIFYMYLPAPTLTLLSIGIGLSLAFVLLGLFTMPKRPQSHGSRFGSNDYSWED